MEKTSYSLSKKAFIISFGKVINRASALFAIIYLSYSLSKDVYGSYRQVWLLFNTLVPIISLGIPVSINYFIPLLDNKERKTFAIQTYLLLAILGLLFSFILFFGSNYFGILFQNSNISTLIKYFSIIPFLCLPTLFYQNLFVCLDNPVLATKVSLFSSITYILSIIIPIYLGYSVLDMIMILTCHYIIQFILFSFLMYQAFIDIDFNYSFNLLKKQISYAVPVGLTSTIGILSINIDKFFIATFFDSKTFAEYTNGSMELPFIGILTGSIMAILMPEFVKLYKSKDIKNLIKIWHSSIVKVAFIFFPLMCFLFLFADIIVTLLFSSKYISSTGIFKIYLLTLPSRITIFGIILLSMNLSKYVLKYSIYTFILNIILNYKLIKKIGVFGPAIATIIIIYSINLIQLNKIGQIFNYNFISIFPWKKLRDIMLVSLLSIVIVYIFNEILLTKILQLFNSLAIIFISGIIYLFIYLLLSTMLKVFPLEEIKKTIRGVI